MSSKRTFPPQDAAVLTDRELADALAAAQSAEAAHPPGVFRRLLEAMAASRRRQAEAEIARYLGRTGGLNDEADRKLSEALTRGRAPR
ncbi:MAG: hypothetical protein JNK46_11220 [Methylobacteriaceae bacterium]|nr:hypothetical protein [Methylobacteriaceae bacterium]